jgi:hypothetical protein
VELSLRVSECPACERGRAGGRVCASTAQ